MPFSETVEEVVDNLCAGATNKKNAQYHLHPVKVTPIVDSSEFITEIHGHFYCFNCHSCFLEGSRDDDFDVPAVIFKATSEHEGNFMIIENQREKPANHRHGHQHQRE